MSKHITIKRPNGSIVIVRSVIESATEDELTLHEQIINELEKENQVLKETMLNKY